MSGPAAFWQHILFGLTAARPVATTVHDGTLYAETDGAFIWKSDGATWTLYGLQIPPGGATGDALVKASNDDGDYTWVTP